MNNTRRFIAWAVVLVWQWKFTKEALAASMDAARCAYDYETRVQRTNEAMGIVILKNAFESEVDVTLSGKLTDWTRAIIEMKGMFGRAYLIKAGWTHRNILRLSHRTLLELGVPDEKVAPQLKAY